MSTTRFDGIVLHRRDFGEAHRIIEVLTPDSGRLSLLARGGRASRRRFAGALDQFLHLRMEVSTRGRLWSLSSARVLEPRVGIRSDWASYVRANVVCECARLLTPEHADAADMYAVVNEGLERLDAHEVIAAARAFPRLLRAAGIAPALDQCVRCKGRGELVDLDPVAGGAICSGCTRATARAVLDVFAGRAVANRQVADAVEAYAARCVEAHIGRRLQSRKAQLRSESSQWT